MSDEEDEEEPELFRKNKDKSVDEGCSDDPLARRLNMMFVLLMHPSTHHSARDLASHHIVPRSPCSAYVVDTQNEYF